MRQILPIVSLVVFANALSGCAPHVYSPPARIAPMEVAKPAGEGETSVGAAAGTAGEIFGVETLNATARVRHGVTEHSEVGVDANLMKVDDSEAAADIDPYVWSARVGGKWAPKMLDDYVGLVYGVGAGTSEGGQFVSPDVGLVAAFENRYLVPFASIDGYVSQPLNAQPVDVSNRDQGAGANIQTAKTTWGMTAAAGLKWPISVGSATFSPIGGMSFTQLTDGDEDAQVVGFNLGADVAFE